MLTTSCFRGATPERDAGPTAVPWVRPDTSVRPQNDIELFEGLEYVMEIEADALLKRRLGRTGKDTWVRDLY
jgi:hypothetical protein